MLKATLQWDPAVDVLLNRLPNRFISPGRRGTQPLEQEVGQLAEGLDDHDAFVIFPELEFDIPTRSEGDCLARYLLRMDEIKQSLRIIDQCLEQMPDGPIMAKLPRLIRPRPGRAWSAVEGPRGVYGAYAISDGTDQPFRLKIHDPSFIHLQAVGALLPGNLLADTMAIMASLDPVMGGVDK